MTNTNTCPICGKTVAPERIAQYPRAVSCGSECGESHRRTQLNKHRKNYRHRRLASDPAFVLREKQKARERYVVARLRLGKTPAERAPIATERGATDTLRGRAVWALRAVWAAISAIPRNGRAVDAPQPGE